MAGLCWMAVMLVFFLSAENGLAVVDQNRLATIVNGILREYNPRGGMFSLAVRIPYDQNQNINTALQQVFTSDPGNNVVNTINNNKQDVYNRGRVVAAKVRRRPNGGADHAESRVVNHLKDLFNRGNVNDHDLLLFYVYSSPCIDKCSSDTHYESIIGRIKNIKKWTNYALVFSKIFKPNNDHTYKKEELMDGLKRIGKAIGLNNIFRCDGRFGQVKCTSCADGQGVAGYCVSDPQPTSTSG